MINMKKFREITYLAIKIAAAISAAAFCLTRTETVKSAVYEAVMRCLTIIIPSLYAMMIMSGFLVKSNIIGKTPCCVTKPGKLIFGMNGGVFPIFLFSMFAGYPVGAKMLCSEYECGNISKKSAEVFSGICYGAGPAFIFGCISSQIYGSSAAGRLILISAVAANLLLAFIFSFGMRKESSGNRGSSKLNISAKVLTDSILGGGRSIADICIMITAFSVLTAFLRETGAIGLAGGLISQFTDISPENAEGLILAFLDVTAVGGLEKNNYELLPAICGLTSFGGICVIMQIGALTSGRINIKPLVITRAAAALLSAAVCRIFMPYMLSGETVSAAGIHFAAHREPSPVPSILLILMTVFLFREYERLGKRGG